MNAVHKALFLLLLLGGLGACDLEKEIDIELPEYNSRLVVECYLQPGEPFTLLLTRSAPYFEPFPPPDQQFLETILIDSARVAIVHNGRTFRLNNQLAFNPGTRKVYNYFNPNSVPFDTINPFELLITVPDGRSISASTRILPKIPIDSVVVEFSEADTLGRVLTYFTDNPNQKNYYRRMLHESSLDSNAVQDFSVDDRILEGVAVFGTRYNYAEGDTVINTLYHIDKQYYEFLESLEDAVNSNGNPFAQPSPIISGLGGTANAVGFFTGLSFDRKVTVIKR